jgi:hypothetical protein
MKKTGIGLMKNLPYLLLLGVLALGLITIIGSGGGGGGGSGGTTPDGGGGTTPDGDATAPIILSDADMLVNSGLVDGGVARTSTQTMTGTVPNPTGSSDTYGGKAYLVLNGDRIPLNVTSSGSSSSSAFRRIIYKDGKEYDLDDAEAIDPAILSKMSARNGDAVTWVFSVTFSINAGTNTISIEVYDVNDTLFARTEQWDVIGAIEPTSLVVTLWWDTNQTDIDLHVAEVDDGAVVAHCYYSNPRAGDMMLDYDDTNGYGPEHITVDSVTGTKTYEIRVYYYADHNDSDTTTPTTASVTAAVNGETRISESSSMSSESTASSWTTGSHVWQVGQLEVSGADVYDVILSDPDLSNFPEVTLTLTVEDSSSSSSSARGEHVPDLTSSNFYVVNAGTLMSPVTVTESASSYTVKFTDITAGARDIYVYVYVPAQGDTPMRGGLSNTKTYGTNYALLVGLNEYPAAVVPPATFSWYDEGGAPRINVTVSIAPDGAGDFTATFTDSDGVRASVSLSPSGMQNLGGGSYKLSFPTPANYLDYERVSLTYKKQAWLSNCLNDINDLETALKATTTGMSNSGWQDANIYTLTNSGATEAAITNRINAISTGMQPYDLFLFHFSGHGSNGPDDGSQYLCAYEDDNWISVTDLANALKDIPQPGTANSITNIFVLLDACHSGNFIGRGLEERGFYAEEEITMVPKFRLFIPQRDELPSYGYLKFSRDLQNMPNGNHVFVMTAVTGDKSSWDDSDLGNGVFTYYLVEGINVSGKTISAVLANADNDTWVTAEEAFAYLDPKAQAWVSVANGYPVDAVQDAQVYDNSASTPSRFIYNW